MSSNPKLKENQMLVYFLFTNSLFLRSTVLNKQFEKRIYMILHAYINIISSYRCMHSLSNRKYISRSIRDERNYFNFFYYVHGYKSYPSGALQVSTIPGKINILVRILLPVFNRCYWPLIKYWLFEFLPILVV